MSIISLVFVFVVYKGKKLLEAFTSDQHVAVSIPPPTVVNPVLASVGFNSVGNPSVPQIPMAHPQDIMRKAQDEAKVR